LASPSTLPDVLKGYSRFVSGPLPSHIPRSYGLPSSNYGAPRLRNTTDLMEYSFKWDHSYETVLAVGNVGGKGSVPDYTVEVPCVRI